MSAQEIRTLRNLAAKLVKIEERDKLLGILIKHGIGVREVEEFVKHERGKMRGDVQKSSKSDFKKRREIVVKLMEIKLRDNRREGMKVRKVRNRLRQSIERTLGSNSRQCRWVMRSIRDNGMKMRTKLRKKNTKKIEFLKGKYAQKQDPLEDLKPRDRDKYGGAEIFSETCDMRSEPDQKPSIVLMEGEEIFLDENEVSVLALGPKFCIMNKLCDETFERELEECIIKYRWEIMGDERENEAREKFGKEAYEAIESLFTEDELKGQSEEEQMCEARKRMIFDYNGMSMNLARRRVTDLKGNARVILPRRAKNFDLESKLEMMRLECRGTFAKYMEEKCDKNGNQVSN